MSAINYDMIRDYADKSRDLVDGNTSHVAVDKGRLGIIPLIADVECDISSQQRKIKALLAGFSHEVNRKKTLTRDVWSGKLLQDLDLKLFGFLGCSSMHEDSMDAFPRSTCLMKSKNHFVRDLSKMLDVVGRWRIESGKVVISPELEFSMGGESEAFFGTLLWLRKLVDGGESGRFYAAQWARKTFGVYPGEHMGRGVDAVWSPEDTAVLVRKSLTNENTINRVGRLINELKRNHYVSIIENAGKSSGEIRNYPDQSFNDFGYIEQISMDDLKRVVYTDYRKVVLVDRNGREGVDITESYHISRFELDVTEVTPAGSYAGAVPPDVMENLISFLSSSAGALAGVPFVLTPELYILTGPVRIKTSVIHVFRDPLLILRFAEFPSLLIPVDYWLPVSRVYSAYGE